LQTRRKRASLLALVVVMPVAWADEAPYPSFHLNGFATLGAVHSSERQADFRIGETQGRGAGFSNRWAHDVDSRLGLQATARLTESLSGVVQVVGEQRYDASFGPKVEWANLRYTPGPGLDVRVGRTVLPTFLDSDVRRVGYAQTMLRPPQEVYGLLPITNLDGADIRYRFVTGGTALTVQAFRGQNDFQVAQAERLRASGLTGLFASAAHADFTVRGGYQQGHLRGAVFTEFFDRFRQFGAPGAQIANRYDPAGNTFRLWTIGAKYDGGVVFVRGEWVRSQRRSYMGESTAWHVSGGYRVGRFTPYLGFARRDHRDRAAEPGLPVSDLAPEARAFALRLNAELDELRRSRSSETVSVGVRWDFRPDFSFKVQVDRIRLADGSRGDLANLQPAFRPGGRVDLLSAALEFVF